LADGEAVNGMMWYRPTPTEVDKLEVLGNPGWNWESLEPYMTATEKNTPPDPVQISQGAGLDPELHGFHGAINVSFPVSKLLRIPKQC
jgi:choline dehydrogenase